MNAPYQFFSVFCMLETLIILGNQNQSKDLLLRGLKIQERERTDVRFFETG